MSLRTMMVRAVVCTAAQLGLRLRLKIVAPIKTPSPALR